MHWGNLKRESSRKNSLSKYVSQAADSRWHFIALTKQEHWQPRRAPYSSSPFIVHFMDILPLYHPQESFHKIFALGIQGRWKKVRESGVQKSKRSGKLSWLLISNIIIYTYYDAWHYSCFILYKMQSYLSSDLTLSEFFHN